MNLETISREGIILNLIYKYRQFFIFLPFFLILSLLVFFPTIYGTALWDDWNFIFRNYFLKTAPSVLSYFNGDEYRAWPFTHALLWRMYHYFKESFSYYHLVSILLHGLNGYLCWIFLEKLKIKYSFLLAVIFLVHPLQLFTVAWIIQIKTILSLFFFLISLIFLHKYFHAKKNYFYIVSILAFTVSVLSKSTTSIFGIFLLAVLPFLKSQQGYKKMVCTLIPFVLLSMMAITKTVWDDHLKTLALFALITFFVLIAIIKFHKTLKNNVSYLLPTLAYLGIIYFSFISDINYVLIALSSLLFILAFIFRSYIEKIQIFFQAFCLFTLFYTLPIGKIFIAAMTTLSVSNLVISLKNFIRYVVFIFYPFDNYLFPQNTTTNFSSIEFFYIFIFFSFVFYFYKYLLSQKDLSLKLGIIYFSLTLIPFCGIFILPIFSYTNFSPYWLSIPYLGILPLISHPFNSQKPLIIIALILLTITHIQSYKFVQTENVFLESLTQSSFPNTVKVSLVEHYVFTGKCKKAKETFEEIKETNIAKIFSTSKKVTNCKDKVN